MTHADPAAIRDDLLMMTGGHFTPASLGPDAYDEVLERARAGADDYLDEFERLFLGPEFDARVHANLLLPTALGLLAAAAPERVAQIASRLERLYDAVLVVPDAAPDRQALREVVSDEAMGLTDRLDGRRRELRGLLGR